MNRAYTKFWCGSQLAQRNLFPYSFMLSIVIKKEPKETAKQLLLNVEECKEMSVPLLHRMSCHKGLLRDC